MKKGIFKKTVTLLTTSVLALSSLAFAGTKADAASLGGATYTSPSGTYSFEKISHPNAPLMSTDGIVDYVGNGTVVGSQTEGQAPQGQGDRGQNYSWSSVGYGDYIYIGTCYGAMTSTLTLMGSALGHDFDAETMGAALNALYNGAFFYGEEDGGNAGGVLAKMNVRTGEVTVLMSRNTTGQSPLFRNAIEYKGKLYFCGSVNSIPSIWEIDPSTDEVRQVYAGMTLMEFYQSYLQGICTGIRGMCEFNGQLIVSCVGLEGPYICATTNPSAGAEAFTKIATLDDLFGYPAYHYCDSIYGGSIWEMTEFNGSLYVSLCTGTPDNMPDENTMRSFAVVRGDQAADGSWSWSSLIGDPADGAKYTFGIDPERTRAGAGNLMVYNDYLYIAEYNDEEIALENIIFDLDCDFVNANLEQSVNLYRMDKDENIELVVGDATTMFPNGSLSGLGSGFGRKENQYLWRMQVYDGELYVGTFDTSSLLEPLGQFSNGDILEMSPEEWESELNYIRVLLELLAQANQPTRTDSDAVAAIAEVEDEKADINALSEEQSLELQENLENGSITSGEIDVNQEKKLNQLNDSLDEGRDYLPNNNVEEFYEYYQALYEQFINLRDKLPEALQKRYDELLNNETLHKLSSIIECMNHLSTSECGFDLYVTSDGVNFETITTNGFGDPYNHGLRVFAVTDSGLTIGTANPFYGTQVWLKDGVEEIPTEPSEEESTEVEESTEEESTEAEESTEEESTAAEESTEEESTAAEESSEDDSTKAEEPSEDNSTEAEKSSEDNTIESEESSTTDESGSNTDINAPSTGDYMHVIIWALLLCVAAAGVVAVVIKRRK